MSGTAVRSTTLDAVPFDPAEVAGSLSPFALPGILCFAYEPLTGLTRWISGDSAQMLGIDAKHLSAQGALFLAHIHPCDRFTTQEALDRSLHTGESLSAVYRWIRPDSREVRLLLCRGEAHGSPGVFRGVIIDITEQATTLQGDGELAAGVGLLLPQLGIPGVTLDLEFTIQALSHHNELPADWLGVDDLDSALLIPGASILDAVGSDRSRNILRTALERALARPEKAVEHPGKGYKTLLRALSIHGTPLGMACYVIDLSQDLRHNDSITRLLSDIKNLEAVRATAPALVSLAQEIGAYSALISRHAHSNPLLEAIGSSLANAVEELGSAAATMSTPRDVKISSRSHLEKPTPPCERPPLPAEGSTIVAAVLLRNASAHVLALQDAGLLCEAATLDEGHIAKLIKGSRGVRCVVIDVPPDQKTTAPLIRRIKREHPTVHFIALVPSTETEYGELLRSGVTLLLAKPTPTREIERAIRMLLSFPALGGV